MKWITRERPKIDRIACPWLIKRFIDKDAEIVYVPSANVVEIAHQINAIPFDVPDVEFTHYRDHCTFDYFIEKFQLKDPALFVLATIVRGADTDRHDIASQSSGLWAISAGLGFNFKDDYQLLEQGMVIYDALYSWAKHLQQEKHTESPMEKMLMEVFNKFLKEKAGGKKTPEWAKQLKEIIQDQIDTNLALSLKDISKNLDVHPSYLSREFSKYFEDLSYGEYIRKLRVEKSIQLIHSGNYKLTEVAYLTGFSDQSHFTRIFKLHTGKNPSEFKKKSKKSQ